MNYLAGLFLFLGKPIHKPIKKMFEAVFYLAWQPWQQPVALANKYDYCMYRPPWSLQYGCVETALFCCTVYVYIYIYIFKMTRAQRKWSKKKEVLQNNDLAKVKPSTNDSLSLG